jgi:hypothetical protein
MALILKANKTYEDNHGNIYSDAYAVVDQNNGNKKNKNQHIVLEIYKDSTARTDKKQPISSTSYTVSGDDFNTYFSPEAIAADKDHYNRAYAYLLSLEKFSTDENGSQVSFDPKQYVWADEWESDEV